MRMLKWMVEIKMKAQSIRVKTPKEIDNLSNLLRLNIPHQGWRISYAVWRDNRSLDQNSLMHVIFSDISEYLISKGRTDCTDEWVKEALKNKYLGWEEKEFTDIVTGEKRMREVLRETSKLDKGEAFRFTEQILEWASSIGLEIKMPAKCEYREIMEEQNA